VGTRINQMAEKLKEIAQEIRDNDNQQSYRAF